MPKAKRVRGGVRQRPLSLRASPEGLRLFWKQTLKEQLALEVEDEDANSFPRSLPKNELLCMALNEVAAEQGHGYFLYLPSRDHWKTTADVSLLPATRKAPEPDSRYPSILYLDFTWSEVEVQRFGQEKQRGRYLQCNALINPPASDTPLYAIQVVDHERGVAYSTATPSLIVYQTQDAFYLGTAADLAQPGVVGKWSKRWPAQGADPGSRLNTAPFLWNATTADHFHRQAAMLHMRHESLLSVYNGIVQLCSSIEPSFTSAELHQCVPRPLAPEAGMSLGSNITTGLIDPTLPAYPPTKAGKRRSRKRPVADDEMDDTNSEDENEQRVGEVNTE